MRQPAIGGARRWLAWGVAYLAFAGAVWLGLDQGRRWALRELATPQAQAEWDAWVDDVRAAQDDPGAPVRRRVPKSASPPLLVLLRDHFPAVAGASLAIGTVLFAFLGSAVAGVRRGAPAG